MAFRKQPYNWKMVKCGDIISFSYKGSRSSRRNNYAILVLNPKIPVERKDGSRTFHLTGIKLKKNHKPLVKFSTNIIRIFERIGKLKPVNYEEDLFELDVKPTWLISEIKGIRKNAYEKISTNNIIRNNYRTFNFFKVRRSPVFVEPMRVVEKENYLPDEAKKAIKEQKKIIKKMETRDLKTNKEK